MEISKGEQLLYCRFTEMEKISFKVRCQGQSRESQRDIHLVHGHFDPLSARGLTGSQSTNTKISPMRENICL